MKVIGYTLLAAAVLVALLHYARSPKTATAEKPVTQGATAALRTTAVEAPRKAPGRRSLALEAESLRESERLVDLRLVGTLATESDQPLDGIAVEVAALGHSAPPIRVLADADGGFEADIAALVPEEAEYAAGSLELTVHIDAPAFLPATELLIVPFRGLRTAGAAHRVVEITVELQAAAFFLEGTVVLPTGTAGGPEDVEVAVFKLDAGGNPLEPPEGHARCDPHGRFVLRLVAGGHKAVVAVAEGLRPATALIAPDDDASLRLELTVGQAISGIVVLPIETAAGAMVQARLLGVEEAPSVLWRTLLWLDGRFEYGHTNAHADESGIFAVSGLAPRPYRLALSLVHHWITFTEVGVDVIAPAGNVPLGTSSAQLDVRVETGNAPLAMASVQVATHKAIPGTQVVQKHGKAMQTDKDGGVHAILDSNVEYHLEVRRPGYHLFQEQLTPFGTGERRTLRVELEPIEAMATLEFVVDGRGGLLPQLHVTLEPSGPSRGVGVIDRILRGSGHFVLESLPPGAYRVRVSPTRAVRGVSTWSLLCDANVAVQLEPGETRVERIDLPLGGRFRVDTRALDAAAGVLRYELRDAAGEPVEVYFRSRRLSELPSGGFVAAVDTNHGAIAVGSVFEAFPNLQAGIYSLRVVDSSQEASSYRVSVVEGAVTDVVAR